MRAAVLLPPLLLLLLMTGCRPPEVRQEAGIPRTDRSVEAVQRVRPALDARLQARGFSWGSPVLLRGFKREKELEIWLADATGTYQLFDTLPICALSGVLGPKRAEGDRQVPEGVYAVTARQLNPASSYHLAMNIGYPNEYDRRKNRTGSAIMIHGACASIGCLAMTDAGIEPVYALVEAALAAGVAEIPVFLHPFRPGAKPAPEPPEDAVRLWKSLHLLDQTFTTTRRRPRVGLDADGDYTVAPAESSP
jgi:murein L,D-transpeptidase YafK